MIRGMSNPTTAERIDELVQAVAAVSEDFLDAALDSLPHDSGYFSPEEQVQAAWCASREGGAFLAELERQYDEAQASLSFI